MTGEGGRRRATVAIVVVAAVALVTVVAAGARVPVATEGSGATRTGTRDRPQVIEIPDPLLLPPSQEPIDLPSAGPISVLLDAVLIAGALMLLFAGGRALRRNWRREKTAQRPPPVPGPPPGPPAPTIVEALDEGLGALAAGPVDDVVIACWVHLEDAAASAGVARLASETPSELASRVLTDLHAPPVAVDRLLTRYRTARYSRHPLGEDDRTIAIRSLEDIRTAIVGAHR